MIRFARGVAVREEHEIQPQDKDAPDAPAHPAAAAVIARGIKGMVPDARKGVRILNACGELYGVLDVRRPTHDAWKKVRTLFGAEWHAYTVAANFALQAQHVMFKGAVDPTEVRRLERVLFHDITQDPLEPSLQLMVLQASIGRSLCVNVNCLLERQITSGALMWAVVCSRCEELCNTVSFSIINWDMMLKNLDIPEAHRSALRARPVTATVSLTRRGIMTVRLTWTNAPWTSNQSLLYVTERIGRAVHDIV